CATCEFWYWLTALIRCETSPPCRNFLNKGLNASDWRAAERRRRCLSRIIPTEKRDNSARHTITPPPNIPTFPNSSVNVIYFLLGAAVAGCAAFVLAGAPAGRAVSCVIS